jgi:soluble lytic murein transglycosylase
LTADLLSEFDNEAVPVMAAYNAGEGRAAEWWKAARGVSQDLFVDTIPYAETRTYVRTVYSNYVMYRQLYGSN